MTFDIRQYLSLDAKGRASCPSCALEGKTGKNLSVQLDGDAAGAYKCFRGCTPDQIRQALGATKPAALPPQTITSSPPAKVLVTPGKVKLATEQLLEKSTHALRWLTDRGITPEMIRHYRLGVVRAKVGDSTKESRFVHLPAIAIAIPNHDGTAYYQKKRIRPWVPKEEQPDGYQKWTQYGIPQMVWSTHQPEQPKQTWLCEGEWDAIMLGWAVRHSALKDDVQVSCFTCGAGNVPPDVELEKLRGDVITFYDLDEPGQQGALKVQERLKGRCKVATVPSTTDAATGWDVSDALNAGLFVQLQVAATEATPWAEAKSDNPLRGRLVSNDEMLARAPDFTDWLIDDILTADELFLLAASPRAGKSLLAMTLALAVATGGKFLERPAAQGAVLYIRCEDSETKTKERELKQGWGEKLPVYWLDKFKLSELAHLEELIEELGCRLVVFDTLSRIRDSAVSESSAEMSQLLEPIQEMCKRQRCCGLLVHHTGKVNLANAGDIDVFDTIRGSSAIRATCRGTLILAADERNYRLAVENGWGRFDLQILLDANTLQWRLLGNWLGPDVEVPQKDRVLAYLSQVGSAGIEQIAEATNLPKRSLYEVLKRLQCDDMIEKRGERLQAVYVRKGAEQITLLNNLLTGGDQRPEMRSEQGLDPVCNMSDTKHPQTPSEQGFQGADFEIPPRSIQQIQHVELLLNGCNPDDDSVRGSIQQNTFLPPPPPKSDQSEKSDQNIDHFSESTAPPTPGNLLNRGPKPSQDKALRIQQAIQQAIQHGPVEFNEGDKVGITKPGTLMGQICLVKGFRGDLVVVSRENWAIDREYRPEELELIERSEVANG